MPEALRACGWLVLGLVGVLRWSGGCGGGREPGAGVEELGECVEGVDAPFARGGQVGADDSEVGQAGEGAPGAAGGALLDLDRADVTFGLIWISR